MHDLQIRRYRRAVLVHSSVERDPLVRPTRKSILKALLRPQTLYRNKFGHSQMDPRDALPLVHEAASVNAQCDQLHGQGIRSNVERRKCCQLSSGDDSPVYHIERPPLSS